MNIFLKAIIKNIIEVYKTKEKWQKSNKLFTERLKNGKI